MEVAERIRQRGSQLTTAERRVAEAILESPQAVGFGTVADLAKAADVGAASVVRLAAKLGFDGYSALQQCVRDDLTQQLRPAAERIREAGDAPAPDHVGTEVANVRSTVEAADATDLAALVSRVADVDAPVLIVSGEASAGVARQFGDQLHQLRPGVSSIAGSAVVVQRDLALASPDATAIVIDLRRYERWVLETHRALHDRGIWSAGVTDSMLSPIASLADVTFLVHAASAGPFDSHVGTLALLNLVAVNTAAALRSTAAGRLAEIERAWQADDALTEGTDEARR